MDIGFGVHKGKSVEEILLKEPSYALWVLSIQNAYGQMLAVKNEIQRLIGVFNRRPFIAICHRCRRPATRGSFYRQNTLAMYWCENCDPYSEGADDGKLSIVSTFEEAADHVQLYCQNRKGDLTTVIRNLAIAKGSPKRIGKPQASEFFEARDPNI